MAEINMEGLTPIRKNFVTDTQYYSFACSECENEARSSYCEPYCTQILERRLCWHCNYWVNMEKRLEAQHTQMTIINGHIYTPGNRTSGSFRGMAGRRFDIEYIEPSVYKGTKITTFDLWSGSALPDKLREKFPDTAKFMGGAKKAQAGGTTCWNPSEGKTDPYPLPMKAGIKDLELAD